MTNRNFALVLTIVAAAVAGCATNPGGMKEEKAAATKSHLYTEGVSVIASGVHGSSGSPCVIPAGISKTTNTTSNGPSKDWKDLLGRANTCVNEKNWAGLEALAYEMTRADIDSPWGAYFLAVVAEARGDFPRSMWMIDLAQKKAGGRLGLLFYQRGRNWLRMKETAKAIADFEKAVSLEPHLTEGRLFLGDIHYRDQEMAKASMHYRAALEQDAKSYRALTGLAESLLAQGKSGSAKEAADLYARAVSNHPKQLQPWIRLGYIYETLQKNSELALNTYKGLKSSLDSGAIREKVDFDLNAKIKVLEQTVSALRQPAQAATKKTDAEERSVK